MSKKVVINSFDICGITIDDLEKILYLKNAFNDFMTKKIASDNKLINSDDDETAAFEM